MAIVNRLRTRTLTLGAGVETTLFGRGSDDSGGLEGVLNGATRAALAVASSIAAPTTLTVFARAVRNGEWTRMASPVPWIVPANDALLVTLDREDCSVYEVTVIAENAVGGDLSVGWEAVR